MVDLLKPGHITIPAGPDLLAADGTARYTLGASITVHDLFGERKFVYVKNQHGSAASQGEWLARVALPSTVTANAAGTVTTIKDTAAAYTVDDYVGYFVFCKDDAGAAGAAPEGESSYIVSNTATIITIHPDMPFTVATAASDTFGLWPNAHGRLADSDNDTLACNVFGVVMASSLGDNEYGWCQYYGNHPGAKTTVAALDLTVVTNLIVSTTAGACLVGEVDSGIEKCIGYAYPSIINAGGDFARLKIPAFIRCWNEATIVSTTP